MVLLYVLPTRNTFKLSL